MGSRRNLINWISSFVDQRLEVKWRLAEILFERETDDFMTIKSVRLLVLVIGPVLLVSACSDGPSAGGQSGTVEDGLCVVIRKGEIDVDENAPGFDFPISAVATQLVNEWSAPFTFDNRPQAGTLEIKQTLNPALRPSFVEVGPNPNRTGIEPGSECNNYYELPLKGTFHLKSGEDPTLAQAAYTTTIQITAKKQIKETIVIPYAGKGGALEPDLDLSKHRDVKLVTIITRPYKMEGLRQTDELERPRGRTTWNAEPTSTTAGTTASVSEPVGTCELPLDL